ncbi:MAG: cytochrome c oxidase subunit II [Bacteroidales bacterium]
MFSNASNFVQGVDSAFLIITGISVFFLVALTALMIYFVVKYNRKNGKPAVQIKDNSILEITWITIPMILVLYMFYIGWEGFIPMRQAPKGAMEVTALGSMWKYEFIYPGNKQSDTLVLPIHKAVKVNLASKDVLHGFSVPAFRLKEDMVPQKNNYSWFIPGELGDFDIYCTVYCGLSHSYMNSIIRVVSQEDYEKWLAKVPVKKQDNSLGLKVLEKNGCIACHSTNGTKLVGPSFKGLYGATIEVTTNGANRKITVDSAYIESSIYDPNLDIAVGYPQGVMKSYKGIIKAKDIQLMTEYLKTLK